MDLQEIKHYTDYGYVCVDICLIDRYSGFVRKIVFYTKNRVCIEFIGYGIDDEQGYEFCHTFDSIEEAVSIIEAFLQTPVSEWTNYTKTGAYPNKPIEIDMTTSEKYLLEDISSQKIHLPDKDLFKPKFRL